MTVGEVARVEALEDLPAWPERRDERRAVEGATETPRSLHPSIDFEALEPLSATPAILDALYTINRYAKRFDERADRAYRMGDGAGAKVWSVEKRALYSLKTVALHRIAAGEPADLTLFRHDIDGQPFWLFDLGRHSFHQPIEAVEDALLEAWGTSTDDVEAEPIDYDPDPDGRDLPYSLETALALLAEEGLDANDYLSQEYVVDYRWDVKQYTGWPALDDE